MPRKPNEPYSEKETVERRDAALGPEPRAKEEKPVKKAHPNLDVYITVRMKRYSNIWVYAGRFLSMTREYSRTV